MNTKTPSPGPRPPPPARPPRPKRKIIQITTDTDVTEPDFWGITALCDDGTVWQLPEHESGWSQVPDIPQDENPDE